MKKKSKIITALATAGLCIGGAFLLGGCSSKGDNISDTEAKIKEVYAMAVESGFGGTYEDWLESIKGEIGPKGETGKNGTDGREVEFNVSDTHIQWRYVGETNWNNLIALEDIKGEDLTAEECTITYNFNLGNSYSTTINNQLLSAFNKDGFTKTVANVVDGQIVLEFTQSADKGDYFNLYDMDSIGLGGYFLGWFVDDIKVNKLNVVGGDIKLTAKWTKNIAEVCTTDLFGHEFYNLDSDEQTAWCRPSQNNVQLAPKELYLANGIFYTVEGVSVTTSTNYDSTNPDAEEVCLPDSITDKMLYNMFEFYASSYSHTIFRSYNCIPSDLQSSDITVYQIKNYAFIQHDRIQYCYKIDFETLEATLVSTQCYGNGRIYYDNYVYNIDEKFNVYDKEGKLAEITITKLRDSWMDIYYNTILEETTNSRLDKTTTFNFIVGEKVEYIGTVETGHISSTYKEALVEDSLCKLVVNYFIKNTIKEDVLVQYEDNLIYPINIVYYYVENEEDVPNDGGNYWHYDIDGVTPIVWSL